MTYTVDDVKKLKKGFDTYVGKLDSIIKKLSKKEKLDDSEEKFLKMYLNQTKLEKEPPFSIMNLLHYCWSLSLNLSSNETQQKLGSKFTDNFLGFLKRYRSGSLDIENPVKGSLLVNERFVNDLEGSLGKTIRNIGFAKDAHDLKLDDLEKELKDKTSFYDDLSNFASVTKEGIGSKISTFVGGGSLVTLLKNFELLERGDVEKQTLRLEKLLTLDIDNATKTQVLGNLTKITLEETSSSVSNFDILLFIFAGIGFMVLLTIFTGLFRDRAVGRLFRIIRGRQQTYWNKTYKPEVAKCLTDFYLDIKALIQKYYSHNATEILKEFWNEVQRDQITKDSSVSQVTEPTTQEIQKFIEERTLPHYWLEHENKKEPLT